MDAVSSWRAAEEITFECEPGTLTESKLAAIRNVGVTRLSLGIENFDDAILEANGRAHRSPEIGKAYEYARSLDFPQINIDLIAGMLGETDGNWQSCVEKTIAMAPDSVTIYQMELPFNTTISKNLLTGGSAMQGSDGSVANWSTKRRWVKEAFQALEGAGYIVGSAYTAVKNPSTKFIYRDRLWQGADMVGLGVASFGYVNGVHMQNLDSFEAYCEEIERGAFRWPARCVRRTKRSSSASSCCSSSWARFAPPTSSSKYGVDPLARFQPQLDALAGEGLLTATPTA